MIVLKRYSGKILFVNSGTRTLEKAFWASTGKPATGITMADGLVILIGQPEYWPKRLLSSLRPGGLYYLCARPSFSDILSAAIQKRTAELGVVQLSGATFAFSAPERPGIIIRPGG